MIAKGASGGKGSDGKGRSWGAMARTVLQLRKGTKVYILVGQEGKPACLKVIYHWKIRKISFPYLKKTKQVHSIFPIIEPSIYVTIFNLSFY